MKEVTYEMLPLRERGADKFYLLGHSIAIPNPIVKLLGIN